MIFWSFGFLKMGTVGMVDQTNFHLIKIVIKKLLKLLKKNLNFGINSFSSNLYISIIHS